MGGLSLKTIGSIVLILLRIADKLSDKLQAERYKDEGYEKAKAEQNAEMLRKSNYAKAVKARVEGLSDSDVDKLLHSFEPTDDVQTRTTGSSSSK